MGGKEEPKVKTLRMADVCEKTSLSDSTIRRLIHKRDFPEGVVLSDRRKGWYEHLVDAWLESRPSADNSPIADSPRGRGEAS